MSDIQLDSESFFGKMQKIHQTWNQVKLEWTSSTGISSLFHPSHPPLLTLFFSIQTLTLLCS